jgi:hydroxymethylpyrimidine pyrophosphatase-like HAD family hydrolase
MGNAPEDIQELAEFVTKSNDENGVAYAVERFYLNAKV